MPVPEETIRVAALKTISIDFETANEQRGSACSVGLAWIED
ncbi:DNA polymerase III subunit epsilon, partial [Rhizobium leguminosarum]